MEGETKTKAKKMSVEQVRRLIATRVRLNHMFTRKFYDKKAAWRAIQEQSGLHEFTTEQLKIKWANLTRKYKLLITPPTGGATENGEQTPEDWEHFNEMHEFMSSQHTINPPLVVNSCGVIVENSNNTPRGSQTKEDEDMLEAGPSSSTSGGSHFANPGSTPPGPSSRITEKPEKVTRKGHRYTQQEMFEHFVKDSKRKRKEGKKFLSLLKSIAQAQNIDVPNFDSSSSESDLDA